MGVFSKVFIPGKLWWLAAEVATRYYIPNFAMYSTVNFVYAYRRGFQHLALSGSSPTVESIPSGFVANRELKSAHGSLSFPVFVHICLRLYGPYSRHLVDYEVKIVRKDFEELTFVREIHTPMIWD